LGEEFSSLHPGSGTYPELVAKGGNLGRVEIFLRQISTPKHYGTVSAEGLKVEKWKIFQILRVRDQRHAYIRVRDMAQRRAPNL
jgi:hypothetical protein